MEAYEQAATIVGHIDRETSLHITYCEGFGVSREEMEATEEKQACTAYTRYVTLLPNLICFPLSV